MPSSHLFKQHYLKHPNPIAQLHLRNEERGSCSVISYEALVFVVFQNSCTIFFCILSEW